MSKPKKIAVKYIESNASVHVTEQKACKEGHPFCEAH